MSSYPQILEDLIASLSYLPGIGRRSAERIALYILEADLDKVKKLSELILGVREKIKPCSVCHNFSTGELCSICKNPSRDKSLVCVVEYPKDVLALEKAGVFKGVYYVLLGSISPIEGRGPESIDLSRLINRINKGEVKEVIIATDSDAEGEATAVFLRDVLSKFNIRLSRIGIGLPLGSQIEYADSATLGKALQERKFLL
ncbi:MAG: recombination protein RecR [Candidatus Duberdicusella sinuisediminis]|nr:MAG: recombination protein RecR [Candidatus Omnitrophota bacterium]